MKNAENARIDIDEDDETVTITLTGDEETDPKKVTIIFPGGEVYVVGTSLGHHWAHICLNNEHAGLGWKQDEPTGQLWNVRYDVSDQPMNAEHRVSVLSSPALYHFAMEIRT